MFFFLRCLNNGSVVCEKEVGNNSICLHVEFSFSSRRNCFLERNHRTPTTSSILSRLSSRSQSPVIILSVSKPREGNEIRARTKLIMHLVTHFPEQSPRDAFFFLFLRQSVIRIDLFREFSQLFFSSSIASEIKNNGISDIHPQQHKTSSQKPNQKKTNKFCNSLIAVSSCDIR